MLQALAASDAGGKPPLPFEYEAGWAPELV